MFADTTGDRRVNGHPFTLARTVSDHTGNLMSEDKRLLQPGIANTSLTEPLQVRATDADCFDAHQRLARAWHWQGLVVQT
jgi:hypothetical protein